jgi:5-methylcytosine-specific restriction endonuclease McrA
MKRNYNDLEYERFRKDVLKRDNKSCQMPGCKNKSMLHVHHIEPWANAHSLRYEPSNGIVLCKACHKSITGKESHYVKLFREIVDDKIRRST